MLILTAKPGESIYFTTADGQEIEATYLGRDYAHAKDEIRMGFNADNDIVIEREVVRERRLNREIHEAYQMNEEIGK